MNRLLTFDYRYPIAWGLLNWARGPTFEGLGGLRARGPRVLVMPNISCKAPFQGDPNGKDLSSMQLSSFSVHLCGALWRSIRLEIACRAMPQHCWFSSSTNLPGVSVLGAHGSGLVQREHRCWSLSWPS